MKVLGICCATNAVSLAITTENKIIGEIFFNHNNILSENIVKYIDALVTTTEETLESLQGIAVTSGPGAFTNLRVGLTVAKVMSQLLNIPVIGLDSLDCVVRNNQVSGTIVVIQKACRNEVNAAIFGYTNQLNKQTANFTITIEQLAEKLALNQGPLYLTGDAAEQVFKLIPANDKIFLLPPNHWEPRASTLAFRGAQLLAEGKSDNFISLKPLYSHAPNIRKTTYGKNTNIL